MSLGTKIAQLFDNPSNRLKTAQKRKVRNTTKQYYRDPVVVANAQSRTEKVRGRAREDAQFQEELAREQRRAERIADHGLPDARTIAEQKMVVDNFKEIADTYMETLVDRIKSGVERGFFLDNPMTDFIRMIVEIKPLSMGRKGRNRIIKGLKAVDKELRPTGQYYEALNSALTHEAFDVRPDNWKKQINRLRNPIETLINRLQLGQPRPNYIPDPDPDNIEQGSDDYSLDFETDSELDSLFGSGNYLKKTRQCSHKDMYRRRGKGGKGSGSAARMKWLTDMARQKRAQNPRLTWQGALKLAGAEYRSRGLRL